MSDTTAGPQDARKYEILLFYKFTEIADPDELMKVQRTLCTKLSLKGRVLISPDGLNGTLEGTPEQTQQYIEEVTQDARFSDISWKRSAGTGVAFPKLVVKIRDEVVTTGVDIKDEIGPGKTTGKYLSADDLHQWYLDGKEFYVIDMRNDYEYEVGHFDNAIWAPGMYNFRDMPDMLGEIEHLKDKTIVTTCTGGIRCELASGFLIKHGYKDVYQLHNGIQTYMEKYPDGFFRGKLYVFDGRVVWAPDGARPEIVGKCRVCNIESENMVNWHDDTGRRLHGVICTKCCDEGKVDLQTGYKKEYQKACKV